MEFFSSCTLGFQTLLMRLAVVTGSHVDAFHFKVMASWHSLPRTCESVLLTEP